MRRRYASGLYCRIIAMTQPKPIDRRPIRTREARWAQVITSWLIRGGWTPNSISILGMVAGILAGCSLACTQIEGFRIAGFIAGALFVQLRLMANMFDGMVAIEGKQVSPVGDLYNEIPDRVSDAATLIGCGYAFGGHPLLGYWTTILAIFIAYVRASGRVAGAPQFYIGPMAKQHRMFVVTLGAILSAILPIAWARDLPLLPAPNLMAIGLAIILLGEIITVFRRLDRIQEAIWSQHQEKDRSS